MSSTVQATPGALHCGNVEKEPTIIVRRSLVFFFDVVNDACGYRNEAITSICCIPHNG